MYANINRSVRFSIELPPPFTWTPRLLVVGAANRVMRSISELILPQFLNLLLADYHRWLEGTRDAESPVGSLMAESLGPAESADALDTSELV